MLVAQNITKKFPGVIALQDVSMELYPGKVNAILGENGAGKSTLMKILSGVYPDYEGRILLRGEQVNFNNPREAQNAGIAIIHQELNLVPYLSITENIFLGRELTNSWGMLNANAMKTRTQRLLSRLKLNIDPDTLVGDLKVGQQQVVEIAKALLTDCEVIIMDEPTSAITESEVEVLFGIITELRNEGKVIVYISHKLDELFKIADRYIVLRDGKTIEAGEMKAITQDELIRKMVGRDINVIRNNKIASAEAPVLSVQHINLKHPEHKNRELLKNISFNLCRGEVLGIFGLMGAGRTELLETIFGLHEGLSGGTVNIDGQIVSFRSPGEAMAAGIALVPEDRKKDGLILGLDVKTNIGLTTLPVMQRMGFLNEAKEQQLAQKYIGSLQIKTSSASQLVKNLSGGNQQKIVLAKCLATNPKVLMLDEPTRGIDINAKNEIYKLILELAAGGMGVIVVSSELPEILTISDRVLVMAEGCITAQFTAAEASEDNILKAAIPKTL
ncbi:D-xylose ABC transporter ATP-binding protein [Mucilaginibacter sp. PPCGB 2223]|uniref:sugar ABC transporter ATP-binding protein n=1 Tax=Mucilaginibacter sp. PPCGB 2223 TaxID=1886027 RepID=UPI000825CE8C|nr:sugar ABC transporter ATP-binding protein [Mucilaginibacter sp. PPCGB 2223]OCX54395.1 D-xylose ABC transporter ATP-binding protein [Mucilaginibacter sp. PPCGB 2223]